MKAARLALAALLLLAVMLTACITGGGDPGGYNATATYGAEQFHIQLTAVAAEP